MKRKERYYYLIEHFEKKMPNATSELEFGSAFQLLCATLLSAQCTDKRINQVTPALFKRFPTPYEMAAVEPEDVFEYVRSVSYPNAKSQHLVEMARTLVEKHNGEVPDTMEALVTLPGVGRKTANVVLAVWFGRSSMAVDTHVYRVSHRLGLVSKNANTPYKVEQELLRYIPEEYVSRAHHWLILHGRYVCTSRKPNCEKCDLSSICPKQMEFPKL